MWVYLNDRFVPKEEAVVSVFDHGFLYGDGVFETMRAYQGRVLQLSEHLMRLGRSASSLQLPLPASPSHLAELVRASLTRNSLQEATVRVTVSRGEGDIGLDPALCKRPTLVIIAQPFQPYPPSLYEEGVSVIVVHTRRNLAEAVPPHVKSLNFLNNILAKMEAKAAGAYEGLLLNHAGAVTEGTTSNIFLVQRGRLRTPSLDCGILEGITRSLVLRLARELGIPSEERVVTVDDLFNADECFLTNTTQEILPVREIDGRVLADGRPGPMTRRLHTSFRSGLDRFLDRV